MWVFFVGLCNYAWFVGLFIALPLYMTLISMEKLRVAEARAVRSSEPEGLLRPCATVLLAQSAQLPGTTRTAGGQTAPPSMSAV